MGSHRLLGAGNPVGAVEEGVAQRPVRAQGGIESGGVEGLVVLAPADRADEALIADQELRSTEGERDRPAFELRRGLVDRRERRIGDDRTVTDAVVESAVAEVAIGAVVADGGHVLRLEQEGEAAVCLRLQLERRAQGRSERRVVERVVVRLLDPVAEADRDVRVADGLSERCRLLGKVLLVALRETGRKTGQNADGSAQR